MQLFDIFAKTVDVGSHFGAHLIVNGGPQIDSFGNKSKKKRKMRSKERVGKNMICWLIFEAKTGGPKWWKRCFRIIRVAKYEFSGSCEAERKLMPKEVPKTVKIDHFGGIGSDFEILERFRKRWFFDDFWLAQKWSPKSKKSEKKLCGDVRDQSGEAEPRARRGDGEGKTHPRLGGLRGSDRVRRIGRKEGRSARRPGGSADF